MLCESEDFYLYLVTGGNQYVQRKEKTTLYWYRETGNQYVQWLVGGWVVSCSTDLLVYLRDGPRSVHAATLR